MTKLVESLQKFGLVSLPELDFDDTILSGHQRIKALIAMGKGDVAIEMRMPNRKLTERERKEWNLRANTHFGEFDIDVLMEDFADFNFGEMGMLDLQVNLEHFVLSDLESPEKKESDNSITNKVAVEDNYVAPEVIETDIVQGDLFEFVGKKVRHRLLCGDSTKEEDVERLMNGAKADMVFTDPPYGINEKGDRSKRGGLVKGNKTPDFIDDSISYAIDAFNQPQNSEIPIQVWFGANYYCHNLPQGNNWLVWDKRVEEKQRDTQSDCELAWVKSRFKSIRIFRYLWKGMMKDSERGVKRVHTTQKPIALIEFAINEYELKTKALILDYFLGSGSTMVAAHQLDRNCYGMELEPKYCQVIVDRMRKLDDTLKVYKNGIFLE